MSWLDQLRTASFRNVPFQVDTVDVSAGDNVVLREYPFQDLPTVFRMGEAAEEIKLSAYVIGDDYDEQREALRQVLTGEGELVHPTAGTIRVFVAGKYSIKEAPAAEGGMARFDITFVRAKPRVYPTGATNTQEEAKAKAAAAKAAATEAFARNWVLAKKPGWVVEAAVARVTASVDALWIPLATAAADLGEFNSNLVGSYQAVRDGMEQIVGTPRRLADQVANLFELPPEISNASARGFQEAFRWVFTVSDRVRQVDFEVMSTSSSGFAMYGTGTITTADSGARASLKGLQASSDRLIESLAIAAYVEATASVELENYDDAMAMRAAIHDQLARLLSDASAEAADENMTSTSWHDAMVALYTAALADLLARSRDLVRLTSFTPEAWMPVWYISHRLYGTTAYADEILAMNPHINHPLLVPPGKALRVVRH